jgi:protein O-GlcNAc transferase
LFGFGAVKVTRENKMAAKDQALSLVQKNAAAGDTADTRIAIAQARALGANDLQIARAQALGLSGAGQHQAAIDLLLPFHAKASKDPDLTNMIGVLYKRAGQWDKAAKLLKQADALNPKVTTAAYNLGNLFDVTGDPEKALHWYREVLRRDPKLPDVWRLVGRQYSALGQSDKACGAFRRAFDLAPDNLHIAAYLVQALQRAGQLDQAQAIVAQLRAKRPTDPDVVIIDARLAFRSGDAARGVALLRALLVLVPGHMAASLQLATIIGDGDRRAVNAVLETALAANPRNYDVLERLIESLARSRYDDEAAHITRAYQLAKRLMADFPDRILDAGRSLRTILMRVLDEDRMAQTGDLSQLLPKWQAAGMLSWVHYELGQVQTIEDRIALVEWHRTWGQRASARITPVTPLAQPALAGGRKLRIGLMSSDLRLHPITYFALPLIEGFDRDSVALYCYSFNETAPDALQKHIAGQVTAFRHWPKRPDAQVAEGIAADGLDILFELGGSTAMNKLEVMAYRPARLGASWLGYPHSAGLEQIDLVLTDPYITPPDPRLLIERPFQMPETWVSLSRLFAPHDIAPDLPQDRQGGVISFGTANNPYKYTPACLDAWAEVLRAVPNSRFVFLRPEAGVAAFQQGARDAFARRDVAPDRLDFIGVRGDHMRHYNRIDIALDTLPHVGGTTTCESLWMGVPTISLVGLGFPERLSYSNLSNAGLGDLAVFTRADYVAKAVELAFDTTRRRALRHGLRAQIAAHPLGQPDRFTRHFYDLARKEASA